MPMHKEDLGESRTFLRRLIDIVTPLAEAGPVPSGPPERVTVGTDAGEVDKEEIVGGEGSRLPPERYVGAGKAARGLVEEMLDLGYDRLPQIDVRRHVLEIATIVSQLSNSLESVDRVVELANRLGRRLRK